MSRPPFQKRDCCTEEQTGSYKKLSPLSKWRKISQAYPFTLIQDITKGKYVWVYWPHDFIRPFALSPPYLSQRTTKYIKTACAPSEDTYSLGIYPVWSKSSLSAWRKLGSLATHLAHSEDWSDCADAQADPSPGWSHKPYCRFCRALAHFIFLNSQVTSYFPQLVFFLILYFKNALHIANRFTETIKSFF